MNRTIRMRAGIPALVLTTMATAATAELVTEYAPFIHNTTRPEVLALDGVIDARTAGMFQRALERFQGITTLELASYGGSVYDALPLAYFVRRVGLKTDTPGGKDCASACSYLFFAGVGRDADGRLGVHAIAMPSNDLKAGQRELGEIFRAFEDFGVPSVVHTRMMATPAESMFWFAPDEMIALGLIAQAGAATSDPDLLASLRSQLELEMSIPEWAGPPPGITPAQIATVEQQRRTVVANPNDIGARDTLAGYESAFGNYRVAHQQKARVIEIRGSQASVEDYTMLAYYLVAAAGGQVSSDAELAVRRALRGDRTNGIALYYLGLMYGQNDRADVALSILRDLLARSQPGDPWYQPIRIQIDQLADEAGVNYTLPVALAVAPIETPPVTDAPSADEGREAGDPAVGSDPAPGGAASGGYPEPSGHAVFAWGLCEQTFGSAVLSGQISQTATGAPYSIRIYAEDEFLKVEYPELSCGGYWELMGNEGNTADFRETLTYGQASCRGGAGITAQTGGSGGWTINLSSPAGGGATGSAMLRVN